MKPKIIVMSKQRLIQYIAVLIIIIIGIIVLVTQLNKGDSGAPSSGYAHLQYKDGVYTGSENTDDGSIMVEVTIKRGKIKDIKLVSLPDKYITENPELKGQLEDLSKKIVKAQDVIADIDYSKNTAYILTKFSKAVLTALDQSLIS